MVTVNQSGLPDVVLLLLIFLAVVIGALWVIVFPAVGMLYMLGYLT